MAGRRWSTASKEFFTVATVVGGPRLTEFLVDNIGGPSLSTVGRQRANNHRMELGIHEETFIVLARLYTQMIEKYGLRLGTIVFQLGIDETVVLPSMSVSPCGHYLLGSCGLKESKGSPHVCAPLKIPIRSGSDGYKDICAAFENYVLGHCTFSLLADHVSSTLLPLDCDCLLRGRVQAVAALCLQT